MNQLVLLVIKIHKIQLILLQNITVDVAVPPSFIRRPNNQMCPNGRTARFECQVSGIPTPKIYWLKDAENITINGNLSILIIIQ